MKIETSRFGEVECEEEHIIEFIEGPFGFPEAKRFIVMNHPGNGVFKWLQSVDNADLAFVVVDPFPFFPGYGFDLDSSDVEILELEDPKKALVYTILVVPSEPKKITANLRAPVIINAENRKGRQIVLVDECYGTKHYIFAEETEEQNP